MFNEITAVVVAKAGKVYGCKSPMDSYVGADGNYSYNKLDTVRDLGEESLRLISTAPPPTPHCLL